MSEKKESEYPEYPANIIYAEGAKSRDAEVTALKKELARCDASWQSSESRIVHLCQIAGIDYTCEEPERLEQWAERMKEELAQLTNKCRQTENERSTAMRSAEILARWNTEMTAERDELAFRLQSRINELRSHHAELTDLARTLVHATRQSLQGEATVSVAEEAANEVEEWMEEHK